MNEGQNEHDLPGTVLEQVGKVLFGRGLLLGFGMDALAGDDESYQEKDETENGIKAHGHLPAMLPVMRGPRELENQGQGQADHDELRDIDRDETERIESCALYRLTGHHASECGIRHVVGR